MVGTLPKSKFPNASQEPTLQTGLFEDGSLRPAVLNLFCTPVHSWMAEISAQHKQLQTGHKEATYLGNSAISSDPALEFLKTKNSKIFYKQQLFNIDIWDSITRWSKREANSKLERLEGNAHVRFWKVSTYFWDFRRLHTGEWLCTHHKKDLRKPCLFLLTLYLSQLRVKAKTVTPARELKRPAFYIQHLIHNWKRYLSKACREITSH